jgi:predicted ATP-grasp superfamily ATP-dependent carboligase
VVDLLERGHFDVLLPIHEQGYLFAKVREQIEARVGIALPSFESYERALGKAEFSRVLALLDLPQPETRLVSNVQELRGFEGFPAVVKASIGTASRGVWVVSDRTELQKALEEVRNTFFGELVVQKFIRGPVEHAQAVFAKGRLVAMHAYRQILRGAGGGPAIKDSVQRPVVRSHLARIGAFLNWHGALSVDYVLEETSDLPHYIDCNPRLVEPVNGLCAGVDLTDLVVRISLGEEPPEAAPGREKVRTHLAIQVLFGYAMRNVSRTDLVRECWKLFFQGEPYTHSCEELTPVRLDWPSAIPLTVAAVWLLANPEIASRLHRTGWGAHLLTRDSIRIIRDRIPPNRKGLTDPRYKIC